MHPDPWLPWLPLFLFINRISIFEFVVDETLEEPEFTFVGMDPMLQFVSRDWPAVTSITWGTSESNNVSHPYTVEPPIKK